MDHSRFSYIRCNLAAAYGLVCDVASRISSQANDLAGSIGIANGDTVLAFGRRPAIQGKLIWSD